MADEDNQKDQNPAEEEAQADSQTDAKPEEAKPEAENADNAKEPEGDTDTNVEVSADSAPEEKKEAEKPAEAKPEPLAKAEPKAEAEPKKADKPKADVPAKFKKLVEEIEKLSVLDLSELVKALEERFGVSAAAPMAMAAPAAGGTGGVEADDEKSEYDVVLKDAGSQKINVIKAVREISGLGLAESKAVVDGAPKTVKEKTSKDEANEAKQKLEAAGATVELE